MKRILTMAVLLFMIVGNATSGTFVYDTVNHLSIYTDPTGNRTKWLHLDQSTDMSYYYVNGQLNGGIFDGYRHATTAEVTALILDLFGWDWNAITTSGYSTEYEGRTDQLASVFNYSLAADNGWQELVYGIVATGPAPGLNYILSAHDYNDRYHPGQDWIGKLTQQTQIDGFDNPFVGHFLVQNIDPIPIPATVWLFGSGLLGLIGYAKRKKAT